MVEQNSTFNTDDTQIEKWKVKRLIKNLDEARSNGNSFVSFYIPASEDIGRKVQYLRQELAGAANIQSKATRTSVETALKSTIEKLGQYKFVPKNGLCVFTGVIDKENGKGEQKVCLDIEPFRPMTISTYKCQPTFYTEPLHEVLDDNEKFGFIVMDGAGILFGTLHGNVKEVQQTKFVTLPKKHGKGGQSAMRFARTRLEKRAAYLTMCTEWAVNNFITNDKPNVKGIVLAGSAEFKNQLNDTEKLDKRLKSIILGVYDVSYGQQQGFNQAITLAADVLSDVKFVQEKKLLSKFYDEIALDTGMIQFGVDDTIKAMTMGAVSTLILWENIDYTRYDLKNPATGDTRVKFLSDVQIKDPKHLKDPETGVDLEVVDSMGLADWLLMHYGDFGVKIELITDQSSEGFQFCKGFGGIGGFLRYKCEIDNIIGDATGQYDDYDEDDFFI